MIGAVVIGGHVQGLGLLRALGIMGIPTYLLDETNQNIARYSKYCNNFIKLPACAFSSATDFVDILIFVGSGTCQSNIFVDFNSLEYFLF